MSEYTFIWFGDVPMYLIPKNILKIVKGMWYAYLVAKELELELTHTHKEFGTGILGKMVAKKLKIPAIHTYHTMYDDYLHYIGHW